METSIFQLTSDATPLALPPNFLLPEDERPHLSQVSTLASIPIIDLNDHGTEKGDLPSPLIQKISQACEEYGFFQIINHGVPQELCNRIMTVITNFYELPFEERQQFFTTDFSKQVKLFNYYLKTEDQEKISMWSQSFYHPWHPTEDMGYLLPENPPQFREVFAEYAKEIASLMTRLLSLLSQGLGLEKDCLQKRLGEKPTLKAQSNYYPPCPEPELTLGLATHTDLNALTVLLQSEGVTGLQVIKDGKWIAIDPVPNAFVINLGDQLQVLSNGRYKSVHHRAVTNKVQRRVTLAMFYGPNKDTVIGPIEDLVDEEHPPMYGHYRYAEFLEEFFRQEGTRRMVKEAFELQNLRLSKLVSVNCSQHKLGVLALITSQFLNQPIGTFGAPHIVFMETAIPHVTSNTTPHSLPPNFILPEDKRPHLSQVSDLASIPIIDLSDHGTENGDLPSPLIQKISQACEEYGFFQIINHGVPQELCNKMIAVLSNFFELPFEERQQFFTTDFSKQVKLFSYFLKNEGQEKISMWSQSFNHPWHPTEDMSYLLPENPPQFREVFAEYAKEIARLMTRLLGLLSQGLGLERDCLQKRLGEKPTLIAQSNYYPPCPEPELTLGLATHTDMYGLTVLLQSEGVTGLQVIKDGKWAAVGSVPNAFIINLGDQLQVLSNKKYRSVHHRVVTNKMQRRVTLAMFYGPNVDTEIGPIEDLVNEEHPPLYRHYRFAEFFQEFLRQEGTRRMVKEAFEIQN